jgi:hypothetical protein
MRSSGSDATGRFERVRVGFPIPSPALFRPVPCAYIPSSDLAHVDRSRGTIGVAGACSTLAADNRGVWTWTVSRADNVHVRQVRAQRVPCAIPGPCSTLPGCTRAPLCASAGARARDACSGPVAALGSRVGMQPHVLRTHRIA